MHRADFIKNDVLLKDHSTLKIGGIARFFAEPESEEEVIHALNFAKENRLPWYVIGNGSNLLFNDRGYDGVIIKIGNAFSHIEVDEQTITVQAGAWMPYVARVSQKYGLSGLEHTIGIPGNIGGMVTMNGGSQQQYISTNIQKITVIDEEMNKKEFTPEECHFGYRDSLFKEGKYIILSVVLKLDYKEKSLIRKEMLDILKSRRVKFPRKKPNCGSVFQSDPKYYAHYGSPGKIIEDLGLKGYSQGDVSVSRQHANFFTNNGNATAEEFKRLHQKVQDKILKHHGFLIETEVICVDNDRPKPLVSMISVFYNRGHLADVSIQSMIDQTCHNMEIILVDDGSTDDTLEKLLPYASQKVKVISHENMGFVKSIKKAVEVVASGQFIAIHGSGDISYPTRVDEQVTLLQNNHKVGFVGCWRDAVDKNDSLVKKYKNVKTIITHQDLILQNAFSHGEVTFRKDIYLQAEGYNTYFTYAQDIDLWIRMSKIKKAFIIPKILYRKKISLDGVSYKCQTYVMQRKYALLARRKKDSTPLKNIDVEIADRSVWNTILRRLFILLALKRFHEAKSCLKKLLFIK